MEFQTVDLRLIQLEGCILDVGAGKEGIVARHSGSRVISIDKRRDQLMKALDIGLKIVMDASNMGFLDHTFETVTSFYALMHMEESELERFFAEAYRVMKTGGTFWIWDTAMSLETKADLFEVQLNVKVSPKLTVKTSYSAGCMREQSVEGVFGLCQKAGFSVERCDQAGSAFMMCARK